MPAVEFFEKSRNEIRHWLRRQWTFADVGEHWDAVDDYDQINEETYSYSRRFLDALRLSNLPSGARVLDFCSRTGNGTAFFYSQGKIGQVVCADVSAKMGRICIDRLKGLGVQDFLWVPIGDFPLPFSEGAFDVVLCFETIEHFSRPDGLLTELGRVTRRGGTLILTTPNILWEPVHALAAVTGLHHSEGPHRFIRHRPLLRMVAQAGFRIEKEETTVLIPGGPDILVRLGERLEQLARGAPMRALGLRRVLICRRP